MSKEDFYKVWKGSSREDILNQYYYDRKDLMDTIDKAIEYIENEFEEVGGCVSGSDLPYYVIEELLDILKGSDSNE